MNLTSESTEQSPTTEQVDSTNETASIEEEAKSSDTVVQEEQNNERVSLQLFGLFDRGNSDFVLSLRNILSL